MENTNIELPADVELEDKLLQFLEKAQSKKQSIQSFVDYITDGMFTIRENQERYQVLLANHSQQRPAGINAAQGHWLGDLSNLQKKRELYHVLQEYQEKITGNKHSFKIMKTRLIGELENVK